jgi:hypothetical protein
MYFLQWDCKFLRVVKIAARTHTISAIVRTKPVLKR